MKIQPEAHNAIEILLDDGSVIRMYHSLHGGHDCLQLTIPQSVRETGKGLRVEIMDGIGGRLDWVTVAEAPTIRITVREATNDTST